MSRIILEFKSWFNDNLSEEIQNIRDLPSGMKDLIYKHYHKTYSDAGMSSIWTKEDFFWRANKWMAAGNLPKIGEDGQEVNPEAVGFVTARDEHGAIKLTGMDGPNTKAKVRGLMELVALNRPMWGAMDKDFTDKLKRAGFSSPPGSAMEKLYPIIQNDPQFLSGGTWGSLNPDGGINFELSGIGATVKYFTGNKPFFRQMLEKHGPKMGLDSKVMGMLKNWNSLPNMMKQMALPMAAAKGIDQPTIEWMADVMSDTPVKEKITPAPGLGEKPPSIPSPLSPSPSLGEKPSPGISPH